MVTQMLLLRFQMCAVVNRVGVLHVRHRKSTMPRSQTQTSQICRRQHRAFAHRHHVRRSTSIETRDLQNALLFSIFATATGNPEYRVSSQSQTSQVSAVNSRLHASAATIAVQLASKRNITKALQGQQAEFGAMRLLLSNTQASDVTAATAGIK